MRSVSILALGASLASAIQFTDPAANATLTKGSNFDLSWTTVDTDPTTFSVYLVNFVNWPPFYTLLDLDLETSAGEASVRIPCDVDNSYGWQFNAINGTNVYVIYAQTDKFFVTGDSCTDPTTTAPSCAAPTVTQVVTVRGNSSSAVTTPAALVSGATPTSTFEGYCPQTIGWSGNYSEPVILTSTPHAGRGLAEATALPTASLTEGSNAVPTLAPTGLYWNTTLTTVTPAGPTATGLTGADTKVAAGKKDCSKKRQARKRHSDGGRRSPFPRV